MSGQARIENAIEVGPVPAATREDVLRSDDGEGTREWRAYVKRQQRRAAAKAARMRVGAR